MVGSESERKTEKERKRGRKRKVGVCIKIELSTLINGGQLERERER